MIDETTAEAVALYVFDLLEPMDAQALARRMEGDEELRTLVKELTATAAVLAHTAPARPLPAALEARVLTAVRPKEEKTIAFPPQRRSPALWIGWALAACLATGGVLLWGELASLRTALLASDSEQARLRTQLEAVQAENYDAQTRLAGVKADGATLRTELAEAQTELAKVREHDALNEVRIATLTSKLQNVPDASAIVLWDEEKQRGVLRTKKLPAPPADHDYQLWVIDADHPAPVSAGVFSKENVDFRPEAPVKAPKAFAVSLEAKGGVPEVKGPIVMVGE